MDWRRNVPLDRAAIDDALVAALAGDAALAGLMPDGVWFDQAPPNARQFVTIALFDGEDVATFGGRALDDALYVVQAIGLNTSPETVLAAAARIDAVLEHAELEVAGAVCMAIYREQPIRYHEPADVEPNVRWHHCGGHYRVQFSIAGA